PEEDFPVDEPNLSDTNIDYETAAGSINAFAWDLYQQLIAAKPGENVFFSPYSISTALAMTYAGAKEQTKEQMAEVLNYDPPDEQLHAGFGQLQNHLDGEGEERNYVLNVANALWAQEGYAFLNEYFDLVEQYYGSALYGVDFINATEQTRQTINTWVEEKTHDKIKDLIPEGALSKITRLVLTNAIYFKGTWKIQFVEEDTEDDPFWISSQDYIMAPMMRMTDTFNYWSNDHCKMLELPYDGEELSMIIILPHEREGLEFLEQSLSSATIDDWLTQLTSRKVQVYLPKFELTDMCKLKDILSQMGMPIAFSNGADFSGMVDMSIPRNDDGVKIGEVLHKAFIEVNEEGTEAAAATAVIMVGITSVGDSPPPLPIFRADHPFVYLIRDNLSGSILFLGRMMNPVTE
ncbi:unnamed protein product, partial [marine sediment metagenome]